MRIVNVPPLSGAFAPTAYNAGDLAGMLHVRLSDRCESFDVDVDLPCAVRF